MNFFTDIWDSLRTFYASRYEPEYMRPLAEWFWRVLLTVALFSLIAILFYGVIQFYGVMRKLSVGEGAKPSRQVDLLSREELANTLELLAEREVSYEAAKRGRSGISDPSR
jgi:hypothetical protein